jgi:hypothetical protein
MRPTFNDFDLDKSNNNRYYDDAGENLDNFMTVSRPAQ